MTKTITLAFWAGGGVWGQSQLINAKHIVDQTNIHLSDIVDIHTAGSIGNIAGLVTATKKPYQTAQEEFRDCATKMMGGKLRSVQLTRSVIHSLRNLQQCRWYNPRNIVLRDHSGKIHLQHSILEQFLQQTLGDTKLEDLDPAFVSIAHSMTENDRICFAHMGKFDLFDETKWTVVPNHGAHHRVTDIVMASTAAPTVFGSHSVNGQSYIDCASLCSPLSTVRNIFRMVADPENTRVEILYFGTGFTEETIWCHETYNNQGILQILADWEKSKAHGNIKSDFREIEADFDDRVSLHMIDTPVPSELHGKPFIHDAFNGSTEYMDAVEEITLNSLQTTGDHFGNIIERIAEQKAREAAVDPLTVSLA